MKAITLTILCLFLANANASTPSIAKHESLGNLISSIAAVCQTSAGKEKKPRHFVDIDETTTALKWLNSMEVIVENSDAGMLANRVVAETEYRGEVPANDATEDEVKACYEMVKHTMDALKEN